MKWKELLRPDWDALEAAAREARVRKRARPTLEVLQARAAREDAARRARAALLPPVGFAAHHGRYCKQPWLRGELSRVERIVVGMEPGRWYGRTDVRLAFGWASDDTRSALMKLWRRGWIERARNPDYRPTAFGVPQEPLWLYRLTPAGLKRRRYLMVLS